MAYYPIKCVRCAHVMKNDEVLFDTSDTIVTLPGQLGFVADEEYEEETPKEDSFLDDDGSDDAQPSLSSGFFFDEEPEKKEEPEFKTVGKRKFGKYMRYAQIKAFCEENGGSCEPEYQPVSVTPDFRGKVPESEKNADLLVKVRFKKDRNDKESEATRRVCPVCGCEIPAQSGSMPTYNVTLMGTSASGKTVYLCALNHALMNNLGILPYNGNLSCISASRSNTDLLNKSNELFDNGVLPGTTQIVYTEPLVVQMTFTLGRYRKRCLLALSDMRGEDFSNEAGVNLQQKGVIFSSADAFMMLISPLNMGTISAKLMVQGTGEEYNTGVHHSMMTNISQYILPNFRNGVITAPSTIMLSKCDELMRNKDILSEIIEPFNPVVTPEPKIKYTGTYFKSQSEGTRKIVKTDPVLYNGLVNIFRGAYFSSFSSLGIGAQIEKQGDDKVVRNPLMIRPVRVLDSMLYILIRLGFLPEYYGIEYGPNFNASNAKILQKWVDNCT